MTIKTGAKSSKTRIAKGVPVDFARNLPKRANKVTKATVELPAAICLVPVWSERGTI